MKITFQKGKRAGEDLTFSPPGVFIGRESDNDLQLLVDGVSQYHAKIMFVQNEWIIHDLKSSNGTKVNGKKIKEPTSLKSGDMIYIAKEALKIEYDEKKQEKEEKTGNVLDINTDEGIKIRSPEEAKKTLPPETEPEKPDDTKKETGGIPKKSKEQKAKEREINILVQEALREKKKRLTIIAIIIAIIANAIVFLWYYSRIM